MARWRAIPFRFVPLTVVKIPKMRPAVTQGAQISVTVPVSAQQQFFRLKSQ